MASIPDDIDTASPDDCDRAQAVVVLDLGKDLTLLLADRLTSMLDEHAHLHHRLALASRKVGTAIQIDLVSERAGVVGPALDALCTALRSEHGNARIRVPGWQRAFYGWERAIWTTSGRLRPEAIG